MMTPNDDNRDKPFNPFEENDEFPPFGNQPPPFNPQPPPYQDPSQNFGNPPQQNYGDQSQSGYGEQQGFGNQQWQPETPNYGDQPVPPADQPPQFNPEALEPEPEPLELQQEAVAGYAGTFEEPAQLDLGDDDTRLPWLEGDDDEEEYTGYGLGQVILLALLGLGALGLLVGGIWWATRDRPDAELVADGGTIAAPSTPYKTRPENPGGEPVSGSGDTRFAVAEGQNRPVQIDENAPPARPGFESVDKSGTPASGAAKPADAPKAAAPAPASTDASGPGVQVGAYSTRDAAEKGWAKLQQQYSGFSGMRYRILQGKADIGTVYRLQAVPGDKAAADALCGKLKTAGISCQVK